MKNNTATITKENLDKFFKRDCLSKRILYNLLDFRNYYSITGIFSEGKITLRKGSNIYKALIRAGYEAKEIVDSNFLIMLLSKRPHKSQGYKVFVIDRRLIKRNI